MNKHINFYDISGGLLKGKRAIPQDAAGSSRSIWFAESGGRAHRVAVSTEKGDFVGNFKLKAEFSPLLIFFIRKSLASAKTAAMTSHSSAGSRIALGLGAAHVGWSILGSSGAPGLPQDTMRASGTGGAPQSQAHQGERGGHPQGT